MIAFKDFYIDLDVFDDARWCRDIGIAPNEAGVTKAVGGEVHPDLQSQYVRDVIVMMTTGEWGHDEIEVGRNSLV